MFAGMRTLGDDANPLDGLSDDKPIILDDDAEDFEAFALWFMHCK